MGVHHSRCSNMYMTALHWASNVDSTKHVQERTVYATSCHNEPLCTQGVAGIPPPLCEVYGLSETAHVGKKTNKKHKIRIWLSSQSVTSNARAVTTAVVTFLTSESGHKHSFTLSLPGLLALRASSIWCGFGSNTMPLVPTFLNLLQCLPSTRFQA